MGAGASVNEVELQLTGRTNASEADAGVKHCLSIEQTSTQEASIQQALVYRRCLMAGTLTDAAGQDIQLKGICGRICHGHEPGHFDTLSGPQPAAKLVFTMGSDGLRALVGKSCLDMLLSVGYSAMYIYRKTVKSGCSFVLAVMPAIEGSAWPSTWKGLFDALQSEYSEVWPLVESVQDDLQRLTFHEMEEAYMAEGWPALRGVDKASHITLDKLRELKASGSLKAHHVRACLYDLLHIRENFHGDGFTWKLDGERGHSEYLATNTVCSASRQRHIIFCPLGSPTVQEVTRYMCDALKDAQRRRELVKKPAIPLSPSNTQNSLQQAEPAAMEKLAESPLQYLLRLQTHERVPEGAQLSGLCGRVCRGSHSANFRGLAEMDGSRKIVFMFGPDGLAKFLGNSEPLTILLGLGYDIMFLYEELMKGTVFELVVFKETKGVRQATWENLPSIIQEAFGGSGEELSKIVTEHLSALQEKSFHDLQQEYLDDDGHVMSMHEARTKPVATLDDNDQKPPWRMTEGLLLKRSHQGNCRAADVRAFLYHALNLNNLYSGDGYTYTHDGTRGISEYLAANLPRKELGKAGDDWISCPIGGVTVDQCMSEICTAYEREVLGLMQNAT